MDVLPALAAVALVLAAFARLRRTWPDAAQSVALALPLAVAVAASAGPPPPAAETSATTLSALRTEPYRLLEPDRRGLLLPLTAWPMALLLGDAAAVRATTAVAAAVALLLAYALCRSATLDPLASLVGQLTLIPVSLLALGMGRARFDHALPQTLALLLLCHLVRRLGHLEGARDNAGAFAYLLLAQAAGPAATLETGLLVLVLASAEAATGGRRRALRLATSWTVAAALVLAARYGPVVLGPSPAGSAAAPAPEPALPIFAALAGGLGLVWLPASTRAPRVLAAALVAGLVAALTSPRLAAGAATLPGLALLAPAVAAGCAAAFARVRSAWTRAAPGSRSSPSIG